MEYGFNTRRRRNMDLSKIKGDFKRPRDNTFGINWGTEQNQEEANAVEHVNDWEMESEWEEVKEASAEPGDENLRQPPSNGQPELSFSERQNAKIADLRRPDTPYPGLQKRPDFDEQHKKLTIYVKKDLMERMEWLKKERYIQSYSWLVEEAIRFFLREKAIEKE